jgi:Acetokinase family
VTPAEQRTGDRTMTVRSDDDQIGVDHACVMDDLLDGLANGQFVMETRSGSIDPGALDDPLGFRVYTYRISGTVAQMATALGGLDALAFSGGVGENRPDVRAEIVESVRFLGEFAVEVVPAREELVIAGGVRDLLGR